MGRLDGVDGVDGIDGIFGSLYPRSSFFSKTLKEVERRSNSVVSSPSFFDSSLAKIACRFAFSVCFFSLPFQ